MENSEDGDEDIENVMANSAHRNQQTQKQIQKQRQRQTLSDHGDSSSQSARESFEANKALLAQLPPVFPQQQTAIKQWLFTLGLSIHEGEHPSNR